jgi:hypothetical protein
MGLDSTDPCVKACFDAFTDCTQNNPAGGTACLGQLSYCLQNCQGQGQN